MSAAMNPLEKCKSLLLDSLVADLELHEAGADTWEILLGQFKSVIIVEDLGGLCQRQQLLTLHFV